MEIWEKLRTPINQYQQDLRNTFSQIYQAGFTRTSVIENIEKEKL